ncbi:hypothetical protein MWMV17_MWMV17_03229 [Acinetobacter calcoaceticus]|uniref:O-antigen ligase-related domain-containing protein n=1 Tax=Acinetobacter calcoaceticus DSM 30006 = CIP 81.8 TaxID=981331 RepID=A0ABN0K3T3_ACICA|nr:O-antigen ligase family protein [Acinetobacter calcoaceticus]ENV97787.1 hypothetical protein F936_03439 [Acinetobacter calcoaceticus DSM 30006 = CIP 81.8]CAI3159809.1 hypothetical protein MWMV17_MWMV17_03229 [Acinetobacter calcoaceticus]SUU51666.1 O-antigen ligase [Acinetobacter calcoaceticus]
MINIENFNLNHFIYKLYFSLVFCIFFSTVDVIPTSIYYGFVGLNILLTILLFLALIRNNFLNYKDLVLTLLFIFPIFLSQFFNINNSPNLVRFILIIIFYPIIFFILNYIVSRFSIEKILSPIVLSIGVISIFSALSSLGIVEFEFYGSDANTLDYYADVYSRDRLLAINGIYLNQNSFASILLIGFFSFLNFFISCNKKILKILSALMLFFILILLFLTLARAAIFSVLIGSIFFYIFSNVKIYLKVSILALFALLILALIFISQYGEMFVAKLDSAGLSYRDVIWADALDKFNQNLFFGVGLGNYQFISGGHVYSTHNLYLFFLVSLGILGVSSFILVVLFFLKKLVERIVFYRSDKTILIFSSCVVAILIHQFFEVELDNPFKPLSFFFLLSIAYLFSRPVKNIR